jgi:hypothetical protein
MENSVLISQQGDPDETDPSNANRELSVGVVFLMKEL